MNLRIPAIVFTILLAASTASAKPNLRFGKIEVKPHAALSEYYDSNIYLVPKDQASGARVGGGVLGSFIHEAVAGLKFKFPVTDMHGLTGGYRASGRAYQKQPSANNTFNHAADLAYLYKGPMGIKAKVYDKYLNTEDPAFSELVARETRWQNTAGIDGEYAPEGGKLVAGADVTHTTHKYVSPSLGASLNRYEQSGGVKLGYRIQPKTRVYVGYHRQLIHYTVQGNNRNNKAHMLDGGIEGKLLPKLTGTVQGGLILRNYDDANAGNRKGYVRTGGVKTSLTYKPRERCTAVLSLERSLQESTFSNNRFYFHNSGSLSLKHKFPFKLTASVGASVAIDKYPEASTGGGKTENRRDDVLSQTVGVDYDLTDWLKVGVGYEHSKRSSRFSGQFNYERHLTNFTVKAAL